MGRFEGRNVIVTGGSSGIGRAIVLAFAAEGATVCAGARSAERLAEVVAAAPEGRVEARVLDVRDVPEVRRAVREWTEKKGRLHVLVNCAGIAPEVPVLDITPEQWHDVMATNLTGAFFAAQEAARHMAAQGGGVIVNISSVDATIAESPYADYGASKAALSQLTKCMAFELAHLGVRCVAVAPGLTATPMGFIDDDKTRRAYMGVIPMRRLARPEEQATVVLFLASDEASYVTGVTVPVDGGILHGFWANPSLTPPIPPKPDSLGS
jgi:NAD(P)-dependent dehydrogenase (short-subunit alcohol dehydrogenase family)